MASANRQTASQVEEAPGFEGRYEDLGGYVVGFERYTEDGDAAPMFRGLPDDACQCNHWGVVTKGRVRFRYTDGTTEDYAQGDGYYARPGHTPVFFAGSEVVEFTPAAELAETMAVVRSNLLAGEV